MGASVAEFAVRVVFHDGEAALHGDLVQCAAAFRAQGSAGRILEIRDDVDEAGLDPAGELVHRFWDDAIVVGGDRLESRLEALEGLDGREIGRVLREHEVVRIQEDLPDQIEGLLGTRGDEDIVRGTRDAAGTHLGRDPLAEGGNSVGDAILECAWPDLREHALGGKADIVNREKLWRRQAAGEGDNLGPFGGHSISRIR
jgi:hypothetical protein